ncbi:MAG TPA: class I SAM-dependent methyltransferase, partial [Candidatus Xenobia bacterium]
IGCGVGRVSRFVAGHCQHLTCSDILEQALDGCRQALAAHSNVDYVRTSGRDLQGFADASVDVVYSFTTFFHFDFELVVQYFAEIRRVLRSGGRSILEFKRWNGSDDVVQLLQKIQHCGGLSQYAAAVDKWRYVSRDTLALLCRYYGFVVLNDDTTRFTMAIPE